MRRHPSPAQLAAAAAGVLLSGCNMESANPPPDTALAVFGGGGPIAAGVSRAPGPFDGLYVGRALIQVNPDFKCLKDLPVSGFRVDGNAVRFGGYSGTIQPDGTARLPYGPNLTTGVFTSDGFHGEILLYPVRIGYDVDACTYRADLNRLPS